jgi:hypothetical protein
VTISSTCDFTNGARRRDEIATHGDCWYRYQAMIAASLAVENADYFDDPFPHLQLFPALDGVAFDAMLACLPPLEAFELRGKGLKLELDVTEGATAFSALSEAHRDNVLALRQGVRASAARIAERFAAPLHDKYVWLLGEGIASDVLESGWTTTDGRVMGRAPGYRLKPHTDSAHYGVTCLLYLSDALTPEEGALALYRPDRVPEVRDASTYYPHQEEGIEISLVKTIPVRRNLFVAFVSGPTSIHGYERQSMSSLAWRLAYQCHIIPRGLDMREIGARLSDTHRARWARYLTTPDDSSTM